MLRKYLDWIHDHYKQVLMFCACGQFIALLLATWGHDTVWVIVDAVFLAQSIIAIHYKRNPPDDDESEEDTPDTPFGDAIDRWLKDRQRSNV